MPRSSRSRSSGSSRSGGGLFGGSGTKSSTTTRQAPPPPANYSTAPPPATQQQSGGLFSGLGRTMAEGVAWGTGTAVAREAVGSIFGGRSHHSEAQPATQQAPPAGAMQGPPKPFDPCAEAAKHFADCMSAHNGDFGACEPYFQAMQQCKFREGSVTFSG